MQDGDFLVLLGFCLGAVEMVFVVRFYTRVFGPARIRPWPFLGLALLWMLVCTFAADRVMPAIRPRSFPTLTVLASYALLPFYRVSNRQRLLFGAFLMGLAYGWTMLYDAVTTPLPIHSWTVYLPIHICFWLLLELCRVLSRGGNREVPRPIWTVLFCIPLGSIAVMMVVVRDVARPLDAYIGISPMAVTVIGAFLLINIALFYMFDRFAALVEEERERGLLEQQLALQSDHYRQLERYGELLRSLHHDMRNHLDTARHMLAHSQGGDALDAYLQTASSRLDEAENTVNTGNPHLDSVLNLKLAQLRGEDVSVETALQVPPRMGLRFEQAVTIFGNLLDNAREACGRLPQAERWARLKLRFDSGHLYIELENAAPKAPTLRGGLPVSGKEHPELHGIGLKNVRHMVEETGTMSIEWEAGVFRVRIILYEISPGCGS